WKHMLDSGATITWEAWDQRYKPNQDWNHAWGAAPANLLPRYVLGIQACEPGWTCANIRPHPGNLRHAAGKIPTPRGAIEVAWQRDAPTFNLELTLRPVITARVQLPAQTGATGVLVNGQPANARLTGSWWHLDAPLRGLSTIEVR